jgi:hypothetical protein
MSNRLMAAIWRLVIPIPPMLWHKQVSSMKGAMRRELGFMSKEHRVVHHFVVRELPRAGKPLSPQFIAGELAIPQERVTVVLEELEKHMTFLFRNDKGEVTWAYPVTVDVTPHHLTFSTGEQLYAA